MTKPKKTAPLWSMYKGQCLTCKHWQGDKETQWRAIENSPLCMKRKTGWPEEGQCDEEYEFMSTEVDAGWEGGIATSFFNANFGCVYWEEES